MEKMVIDLNAALDSESLEERRGRGRTITSFAANVQSMLTDLVLAGFDTPVSIRGTQRQIDAFFKALKGEKRFMDSYMKHGLGDSRTMQSQHKLNRSVEAFESETGLKWPFKN
jgi:hypothetical protein|tara:strand:+ start:298 stop:636 length:339 start_codon:yes stop_codon:yes gene_type:complete